MAITDVFGNIIETAEGAIDSAAAAVAAVIDVNTEGFWTSTAGMRYEPKMQYRFKVVIEGFELEDAPGTGFPDFANDQRVPGKDLVWYAKSVEKPTMSLAVMGDKEYPFGSDDADILPAVETPQFKPITMTLVDPTYPNATRKLLRWLRRTGYNDSQTRKAKENFDASGKVNTFYNSIGSVQIMQLNHDGKPLETWTLWNAFPAEINFGSLDYSNEGLVEISITWYYETFKCVGANMPEGQETEQEFEYFNSPGPSKSERRTMGAVCQAAWESYNENGDLDKETWKATRPDGHMCKNVAF